MIKRIFSQSPQSILLLLYFGLMPSLVGSIIIAACLAQSEYIYGLTFFQLFLANLLFALVLAFGLMPTTFFSLLAGYFFGWAAIPFLVFSYALASMVGYWVCGKLEKGVLVKIFAEKYPIETMIEKLSNSGLLLSAFCRMSPTFPFAVLNCIFAMVGFPIATYLMGSMLGMLPRTLFAVYIGTQFTKVNSVSDLHSDSSTIFAVLLAVVSFVGIGWVVKRTLSLVK